VAKFRTFNLSSGKDLVGVDEPDPGVPFGSSWSHLWRQDHGCDMLSTGTGTPSGFTYDNSRYGDN
jgi:hypothetical protein